MSARLPKKRAEISGATVRNPGRYRGRQESRIARPLGDAPNRLTPSQKRLWREFATNLPWLNSSHRVITELACRLASRMDEPNGLGVSGMHALSSLLSKMGATPTDRSRINFVEPEEPDPGDQFFSSRPN